MRHGFWLLCATLVLCYLAAAESWRLFPPEPAALEAATVQAAAIAAVRTERLARGIPINPGTDRNETGLIGDEYTGLTSTLGSLAAKRSAATPEAAALLVRLLREAGITKGSRVAVNASGSFPGFALAAIAACGALEAEAVIVLSLGSSTWGANRPDFTVADIVLAAMERGAFPSGYSTNIAAVTPGGSDDRGLDLDRELLEAALARLAARGIPVLRPASLQESVSLRMALYSNGGEPDLLLTIGGNYASTGADPDLALLSGLIKKSQSIDTNGSGLVQEFLRAGKPVVQVLNVEGLFAWYGLPFDPYPIQPAGTGRVYRDRRLPAMLLLVLAAAALVGYGLLQRKTGKKQGRV